jgi:amidase
LAYSLNGENVHYGTPVNSAAPGRIPGGSSSGSASAAAGGAVDFALGSDTGGSVRVPASYCGVYGFRPSHGRIPLDGACPLAPSFDAAGWFAREPALFARIGEVMLEERLPPRPLSRLLIGTDALAVCDPEARDAVRGVAGRLSAAFDRVEETTVAPEGLAEWMSVFRILQAAEIWRCHGEWIARHRPEFGPGVKERFAFAATVTARQVAEMAPKREAAAARMASLLGPDDVLLIPSAPGAAPLKGSSGPALEDFRARALRLTCIAGLARLPQASLPLASAEGCPLGVSLVARRGADLALLRTALQAASA